MKQYGKVIKINTEDYETLHELKFDLRIDTYAEVIGYLIREHEKAQGVEASAWEH